jgi:hypothetical protein
MENRETLITILGETSKISTVLQSDLPSLGVKTTQAVYRYQAGEISIDELCFGIKVTRVYFLRTPKVCVMRCESTPFAFRLS